MPNVVGTFSQGQPMILTLKFYDDAGVLADASAPALNAHNPQTGQTINYPASSLIHVGTGIYTLSLAFHDAGNWDMSLYDDIPLGARVPGVVIISDDPALP